MRGKLKKAVEKRFESLIQERFPQFSLYRKTGKCIYWMTPRYGDYVFFFYLDIHSQEDGFFIGMGWHNDWHDSIIIPWLGRRPLLKIEYNQAVWRMHDLWSHVEKYIWWDLEPEYSEGVMARVNSMGKGIPPSDWAPFPEHLPAEELLPRIAALVDDALSKFAEYGLPFLRKVAEFHHIPAPESLFHAVGAHAGEEGAAI